MEHELFDSTSEQDSVFDKTLSGSEDEIVDDHDSEFLNYEEKLRRGTFIKGEVSEPKRHAYKEDSKAKVMKRKEKEELLKQYLKL